MTMQQYCLRWNNHQPNFISVFSSLLNSESLVDVTLAAEGRHLQAHKVVLSACSSYFQSLFTINPCQHPIVILKDVKFLDLKIMVDFMYYGEVNVSQEQLPHILKTAEMLKIKGLAEIPVDQSMSRHESSSLERAELLTTSGGAGDTSWNNETQQQSSSPCPSSPSCRKKRLRKSSTGSGSLEKSDHESNLNESTQATTYNVDTVIKSDPGFSPDNCQNLKTNNTSEVDLQQHRCSSIDNNENNSFKQQQPQQVQQPSQISLLSQDYSTPSQQQQQQQSISNETTIEVQRTSTSTTSHQPECGITWTNLVDHTVHYNQASIHYNLSAPPPPTTPTPTAQILDKKLTTSPSSIDSNNENLMNHSDIPLQKKKRHVNPQSEENFIKALDAVRFGGIGFCKAARMYGVNNRTLWLEYKKRGYPNFRLSIKNRKNEKMNNEQPHLLEQNTSTASATAAGSGGHFVELSNNSSGPSNATSSYMDFGQMLHRMNATNLIQHQSHNINYQTVNLEHIN